MDLKDVEKLGEEVEGIIDSAINHNDFSQLNNTLTKAVNDTIRQYQQFMPRRQQVNQKPKKILYANTNSFFNKSILCIAGGSILSIWSILLIIAGSFASLFISGGGAGGLFRLLLLAAGIGLTAYGAGGMGKLSRFKKYKAAIGEKPYGIFKELSRAVQKPLKYVSKEISWMVDKGWFLEGHIDDQETCVITTDEAYSQYRESQKQYEAREAEEKQKYSDEARDMLSKGQEYIHHIHDCNDRIPGEAISEKISHMEGLVNQIFQRASEHPEIIPDLKRMMDYYLPTTVKLLEAYADMDSQAVQGENIQGAKKEIEASLDTLNTAYTNLLDSVFKNVAWDVSSDISVLNTLLAQEGLTSNGVQI